MRCGGRPKMWWWLCRVSGGCTGGKAPARCLSVRPNANIIHEKWRSIRICREEMENLVPNSMNNLNKAMQWFAMRTFPFTIHFPFYVVHVCMNWCVTRKAYSLLPISIPFIRFSCCWFGWKEIGILRIAWYAHSTISSDIVFCVCVCARLSCMCARVCVSAGTTHIGWHRKRMAALRRNARARAGKKGKNRFAECFLCWWKWCQWEWIVRRWKSICRNEKHTLSYINGVCSMCVATALYRLEMCVYVVISHMCNSEVVNFCEHKALCMMKH